MIISKVQILKKPRAFYTKHDERQGRKIKKMYKNVQKSNKANNIKEEEATFLVLLLGKSKMSYVLFVIFIVSTLNTSEC